VWPILESTPPCSDIQIISAILKGEEYLQGLARSVCWEEMSMNWMSLVPFFVGVFKKYLTIIVYPVT
jgi:hypothetical protein